MLGRRLFGFRGETRIEGTVACDLYIARNRPAKDFGRAFCMSIRAAVHAGFSNGRGTIKDEGYGIFIRPGRADMRTYELRHVPTCVNLMPVPWTFQRLEPAGQASNPTPAEGAAAATTACRVAHPQ